MTDTYKAIRRFERFLKDSKTPDIQTGELQEGDELLAVIRYYPDEKRTEIERVDK